MWTQSWQGIAQSPRSPGVERPERPPGARALAGGTLHQNGGGLLDLEGESTGEQSPSDDA